MNRVKATKIVLWSLLVLFAILLLIPLAARQEPKLKQSVACFKSVCINDGTTVTCDNIQPQVGHYQIVQDRDGSSLSVELTGKSCF